MIFPDERRFLALAIVIFGLLALAAPASAALSPLTNFWAPDGDVYHAVELPPPGAGIGVNADPTAPTQATLDYRYSRIGGTVYSVVSDASGGWYVGGDFDQINGTPKKYIAHFDASGALDTTWQVALDGPVYAMVLQDGLLYIGGAFTTANDLSRNHLALIASATGQVSETWGPDADGAVSALVISGGSLVVGGQFTQLVGTTRNHLGAVDKFTAEISTWDPNVDGAVSALALHEDTSLGNTLYVGGSFTQAGGGAHSNLAAISMTDGTQVSGWVRDTDQIVRTLLISGSSLYVGGDFTLLDGLSRGSLGAIDIASTTVTSWDPGADGPVYALAVAGSSLFAGGSFTHMGTSARTHIAAIDTVSGGATSWNPGWSGSAVIRALSWQINGNHSGGVLYVGGDRNVSGGKIYIAGAFSYVGPPTGSGALIPADTALPTSDRPNLNGAHIVGSVWTAVGDGSGGWYIGGAFSSIDGVATGNLAHIDSSGALDLNWMPATNGFVYSLVLDGGVLYAGGLFTQVNGQPRNHLAALDASGVLQAWAPDADNAVVSMTAIGGVLYIGGSFTQVGGQARNRLAAVDSAGVVQAWNPDADGSVNSIAASGTGLYFGGTFTQVGGQPRNRAAAVDTSGVVLPWDPDANGSVMTVATFGSTVYLGGLFTQLGTQTRNHIAALDAAGNLLTWAPDIDGSVNAIVPTVSTVYLGGDFRHVDLLYRRDLAAVDAGTGVVNAWDPGASSAVLTLARQTNAAYPNGVIYCGGAFSSLGGEPRDNLAVLDQSTGELLSWAPSVNDVVRAMELSPDAQTLYIGGDFTAAAGHARLHLAALNTNSGISLDWAAGADARVAALEQSSDGTSLFVGGDFTQIGGQPRTYLAQIRTANGIPVEWKPGLDGGVRTLVRSENSLYVGGAFTNVVGQARYRAAMLDLNQLLLTNWRPQIDDGEVLSILPDPVLGRVYVGGSFTQVAGAPNNGLVAFAQGSAALLTDWTPALDGSVDALSLSGDGTRVYVGGGFLHSGLSVAPYLVSLSSFDGAVDTTWLPVLDGPVGYLQTANDSSRIYAVGGFLSESGRTRPRVADFPLPASETAPPATTISLPGGIYNKTTQADIVLTCDDGFGSGCAATYVTTDGSAPRIAPNLVYTDSIPLSGDMTVRYFSVDRLGNREAEHQAQYLIDLVPPTSTASPGTEVYFGTEVTVTLSCHDKDSLGVSGSGCTDIFYTTDGSLPTTASARYTGPFTLSGAVTLQYFAVDAYGNKEDVNRDEYVRNRIGAGVGGFGPLVCLLLVWAAGRRRCFSHGERGRP
ncbi:MAG: hypothetical protein GC138_08265 [Gammaproteobacteria bacterium]|nr:hypothetical protein [Gammaproteobacteria bacterium]